MYYLLSPKILQSLYELCSKMFCYRHGEALLPLEELGKRSIRAMFKKQVHLDAILEGLVELDN